MGYRWRRIFAFFINPFFSHLSGCCHCKRNWALCAGHGIFYTKNSGVACICEDCFSELSYAQRMIYYEQHFLKYRTRAQWVTIRKLILAQVFGDKKNDDLLPFWIEEDGTPVFIPPGSITLVFTKEEK